MTMLASTWAAITVPWILTGPFEGSVKEIEEANRAVFQNLDIQISYPSKKGIKELEVPQQD